MHLDIVISLQYIVRRVVSLVGGVQVGTILIDLCIGRGNGSMLMRCQRLLRVGVKSQSYDGVMDMRREEISIVVNEKRKEDF